MDDNTNEKASEHLHTLRWQRPMMQCAVAVGLFLASVWTASWILAGEGKVIVSFSVLVLLFGAMSLMLAGAAVREMVYWRVPVLKLRELLRELQNCEAPIDELQNLSRGMTALREPLVSLLHQLRTARGQIAELEREMRQRVANRTEALERKLGTLTAQAARDVLTGLLSRRAMEIELPAVVKTCRQKGVDLQLMMIDVDHFKILNDTLGHQAGDELLKQIGQVMRSSLRDGDLAFRYGGDEFVILMPKADTTAAVALADRLSHLVDGLTRHQRGLVKRPKLSIGRCALTDLSQSATPEQLLATADQRLYAIKHARPKTEQRVA